MIGGFEPVTVSGDTRQHFLGGAFALAESGGCECSQILSVTLLAPADCKVSSSLPKAFAENGQVGSRNTSKTLDPCPQVNGSARHAEFVPTMRSPLLPWTPC